MEFIHPVWASIFLLLLAACIGSLLNVVIYRLPRMMDREWKQECRALLDIQSSNEDEKPFNLCFPASHCPKCDTPIRIRDNIPLLSYLFLRGRCHQCKAEISLRYPAVELSTILLSALALSHFSLTLPLVFALVFIWLVIPILMIDFDTQIIPDALVYALLWTGLLASSFNIFTDLHTAVYSAIGAWLFLWLFVQLFYLITGKIGMGHGDFKLFAAFAAWFGWTMLPLILLLSSFLGAVCGLVYLRMTKQSHQTPIPYGPFLCFSALIALFWGQAIIDAYLALYP